MNTITKNQIPKVIHYCWFGENPLSEEAKKCIASWEKNLPDYKIIQWNESNLNVNICRYTREAYSEKKWAFLSDYFRFYILYNYGGLYFDTDVELISNLNNIINKGNFFGMEPLIKDGIITNKFGINPGLGFGTTPNNAVIKLILDNYNESSFKNDDGSLDLTTIVERVTPLLVPYGFNEALNVNQSVCDFTIYSTEYFCPKNYITNEIILTENTVSIHHYSATWLPDNIKKVIYLKNKLKRKEITFSEFCDLIYLTLEIHKNKILKK